MLTPPTEAPPAAGGGASALAPPRFNPHWADLARPSAVPPSILGTDAPSPSAFMGGGVPPFMGATPGAAPPMVIPLDPKAYGAAIAGHAGTLVLYTVGWCAPCKVFQAEFEHAVPAVQEVNKDVVVGTVDCETYPQFRAWEQIKEFPTVRFYRQGVSDPKQYAGDWREASLVRWVQQQFGLAPAAPPPSPPLVSAADEQAYMRAMRTMVERVRPAPKPASLVPTTDAATLSGETDGADGSLGGVAGIAASPRMGDLTTSLAPLVTRMSPLQQGKFWDRIRKAAAPGGGNAPPSAGERLSFARRLAAEATRAETLGLHQGDGDGDGDDHDHDHGDDTFTEWIADEEMPEGIDDALDD